MTLKPLLCNFHRVIHYTFIQDTDILETFVTNIALLCKIVEKLEFSTKYLDGLVGKKTLYISSHISGQGK